MAIAPFQGDLLPVTAQPARSGIAALIQACGVDPDPLPAPPPSPLPAASRISAPVAAQLSRADAIAAGDAPAADGTRLPRPPGVVAVDPGMVKLPVAQLHEPAGGSWDAPLPNPFAANNPAAPLPLLQSAAASLGLAEHSETAKSSTTAGRKSSRGHKSMRRQPPPAADALVRRLAAASGKPDALQGEPAAQLQADSADAPSALHRQLARSISNARGNAAPGCSLLAAQPGSGTGLFTGPTCAEVSTFAQDSSPIMGRLDTDAAATAPSTPDRSGEGGRRHVGRPTPQTPGQRQ